MGLEEARSLLEAGRAFAETIGDPLESIRLSAAYGRARCGDGDVAGYRELMFESLRAARETDDIVIEAGIHAALVDALAFSGRVSETLEQVEDGLSRYPRQIPEEDWLTAFNPYTVTSFFRGFCFSWMGRLPEALEDFGRHRRLCEEDGSPEFIGYGLFYSGETHYLAHDAKRALASSRELDKLSLELGEPPSLAAYSQLTRAFAHLAAGRASDAINAARNAIDQMARVEKFQAGVPATIIAEALLESGDAAAAQSAAEEAIELCRRSDRSNYEASALGVLARASLRLGGATARKPAEAALDKAAALIERTGASTLAPALLEWRAELAKVLGNDALQQRLLREAQQGYEAMGAPLHAQRIAPEISP